MIVKMHKYSFLVYHQDYKAFLVSLQELGVLHIIEKEKSTLDAILQKQNEIKEFDKTIQLLKKRGIDQTEETQNLSGQEIIEQVGSLQKELISISMEIEEAKRQHQKVNHWGNFSPEIIDKLKSENIHIRFFIAPKKKFDIHQFPNLNLEVVNESTSQVYFVVVQQGDEKLELDAEEVHQPLGSPSKLENEIMALEDKSSQIKSVLDHYARTSIPALTKERELINANLEYEKAILNTETEVDEKIMVLEGWIPEARKSKIDDFLEKNNILHMIGKASPKDHIPILIKNNRFSRLFEPIGKLFSLPAYSEIDLTVFFAPFFMLFFGFCLGDAGYGLLFVIGAGIYKLKAKEEIKPVLSLVQFLGLATVIFGAITGTFFGINLIESDFKLLDNYRSLFLNPDQMFNMALILGALQIVFAMSIKAANQIKQFGFAHSLSTFGWLIIILGSAIYTALTKFDYMAANNTILYAILSVGGFLVIFFSDVEVSIPARVGKGIWDIYSTVTGIFGDILSYIRLFALGLSSAILGFVINDIAMQILGSSKIFGPIFFIVFLLLGHALNIMIASLGSFVHPMRLTFVEFYKNAGFKGGGKEYKPFSK